MVQFVTSPFTWLRKPLIMNLLGVLRQEGGEGRFVGSAVRNSLLGLPVDDYDIATTHCPDTVMRLGREAGYQVIPTGLKHGTVTWRTEGEAFEITTLRQDVRTDGRYADVSFTKRWEEDSARRDFTINALYIDQEGRIYDYWNGLHDLKEQEVRFIGDPTRRIQEDFLRILRFFRFSLFYGKGFDAAGLDACSALQKNLKRLSRERITQETLKIFRAPSLAELCEVWEKSGLSISTYEVSETDAPAIHKLNALEKSINIQAPLLVRLWLYLKGENPHLTFPRGDKKMWSRLADYRLFPEPGEWSALSLKILLADTPRGLLEAWLWIRGVREDVSANHLQRTLEALQTLDVPKFPVTGKDLLAHGIQPGLPMKAVLDDLKKQWKDSGCTLSKQACLKALDAMGRS